MLRLLLLLIIVVPALEITVFILSGKVIGVWYTFALIILTGIFGAWLAKREGLQTIRLAQLQAQQGQLPSGAILDGICIFIGGVLLLAPGFITDFVGLLFLLPFTRSFVKGALRHLFYRLFKNGNFIIMTRR